MNKRAEMDLQQVGGGKMKNHMVNIPVLSIN